MGIEIGDKVPAFKAVRDDGSMFDAATFMENNKAFVLYFYPKNFTPGCTKEACDFRDSYEEFQSMGVEVVGVSSDNVGSHQKFKSKYQLPFIFLSDNKGKLRKLFGVQPGLLGILPGRETYVIDKLGVVRLKFNSINASRHLKKAIETVKNLMNE